MSFLYFTSSGPGERLVVESALPFARRAGRPISVSAVSDWFQGIDIGRSCRFLGSLFRFSCFASWGFTSVYALSHWC